MEHVLKKKGMKYTRFNGFKWVDCTFEEAFEQAERSRKLLRISDKSWEDHYKEKGLTSGRGRG